MKLRLKRRSFYGKGAEVLQTKTKRFHMLGPYYVDLNKLDQGILCVKYTKSDAIHQNIKVQKLTHEAKEMIKDILNSRFNARLFDKMAPDDQRVIKNFVKRAKIDLDIDDDDDFERNFQLLKGEFISGNDNPELKKQLKMYTLHGINEGRIPRSTGMLLLYQLSL